MHAVTGARILAVAAALLTQSVPTYGQTTAAPAASYWVYVANESSDLVSRVRFGPNGVVEEKTISVGIHPTDLDGAHGLFVAPNGRHWYLSLSHGRPYGAVWRFETGTDRFVDSTTVGLFPATIAVSRDGASLFVVNFNLHGDPVTSSVSAVFTPLMTETKKIPTCVRPHGGRLNRDATRHYSACVTSDQLIEIATNRLEVNRRYSLTRGHEGLLSTERSGAVVGGPDACKPTWVAVAPDDRHLYVPCNGRREVLEFETETLDITRRFATGAGPYNADVSADGRVLVVTLKGNQSVAIFDLATGHEVRVATSQPVTHGVVISPDSRFAFISNEAVGATRGTVDVIDLRSKTLVASTEVQYQPGGIGFWKMEIQPRQN